MAYIGYLKKIYKNRFSVVGAVQEIYLSEILGNQKINFLRKIRFWSIKFSILLK